MGLAPYALSIHNFISSVGADAGFASIIGLAILVLLYFAHARETAALREQAAMLADRLQDAEARLAEAARSGMPIVVSRGIAAQPVAAQPAAAEPATSAVPATAAAGATSAVGAARAPGPPAGVGAPALAAATRVVPLTASAAAPAEPSPAWGPAPQPAPAATPPAQAQGAPAPVPAPATAAAAMSAAASSTPARVPAPPVQPGGPSTTAPGAANGGGQAHPRTLPAMGTRQASARLPTRGGPGGGEGRPFAHLTPPSRERSSVRRVATALIGILVVVGAVAVLLVATSSSGNQNKPATTPSTNAPSSHHRANPSFNPAKVTVSVLNGTAVNGLAARVSQRLTSAGYRPGTKADASDQTLTSTTIAYLSGFRTAAMHVAASLRLRATSVKPIDQSTLRVACQGSSSCATDVVVTVGADLANS